MQPNQTADKCRNKIFREFNTADQWSETVRTLQSKAHQQKIGKYYLGWKDELKHARVEKMKEGSRKLGKPNCVAFHKKVVVSNDDLFDDVIDELTKRNHADLFDYQNLYLDPEAMSIIDVLCDDSRHQMDRVLQKGRTLPGSRLFQSLVLFYMWLDLAMKCREARRIKPEA